MLKMRAKLQSPRLDRSRYQVVLETLARENLARAIFEYIVTVQTIIPVWTGASLTTFTDLARLIGAPIVITASGTAASRPNLVTKNQGKARASSGADLKIGNGVFSFSYHTSLPHLVYNEYNNANTDRPPELFAQLKNPGPYDFQGQTKSAVLVVLREFALPDPRDHIKIKKVSI